jgi:tetratricopeptide (TPR) repeat protein
MQFQLSNKQGVATKRAPKTPSIFQDNNCDVEDEQSNVLESTRLADVGVMNAEAGNYDAAITSFRQALFLQPKNFKVLEMLAQVYLETDQLLLALQAAEAAVQENERWKEGLQTLARCQREVGEVHLAQESFEKALRLDPESDELREELLEAQALVSELEEKKKRQMAELQLASTESEQEVHRCVYHLCHRAHSVTNK